MDKSIQLVGHFREEAQITARTVEQILALSASRPHGSFKFTDPHDPMIGVEIRPQPSPENADEWVVLLILLDSNDELEPDGDGEGWTFAQALSAAMNPDGPEPSVDEQGELLAGQPDAETRAPEGGEA